MAGPPRPGADPPTRRAASHHRGNHSRMQHTLRMHMPHAIHLLEPPRPTLCARNETATHTARQNRQAAQKFIMDAKSKPDVRSNSSAA